MSRQKSEILVSKNFMKRKFKIIFLSLLIIAILAITGIYVSHLDIPVMTPQGIIGVEQRNLIAISSILMLIVIVPVYIMTWVIAWKYRADNTKAKHAPDWEHNYIAEYCWWGVPFIIVMIIGFLTWKSSHDLSPYKPIESDKKPIVIQVVALEWKWLFIYPEEGIATVNYIQFPEKTPLNFQITADAPMNSFWIPALGGQIYAMPAMKSQLHLMANDQGTFRGSSSNISGVGFAGMVFQAKSSSDEEYQQWINQVKKNSPALNYDVLVKPSEYDPAAYYRLQESDLFDQILMKYSPKEM